MRVTRRRNGCHPAIESDQPSNRRTPSSSVEFLKQQKSRNNRRQAGDVFNREPDSMRLSKPKSKCGIPDSQDSRVEYRKQAEPDQKSLAVPPPKDIERDSSDAERRYHVANEQ
jgi:hypothetical protein